MSSRAAFGALDQLPSTAPTSSARALDTCMSARSCRLASSAWLRRCSSFGRSGSAAGVPPRLLLLPLLARAERSMPVSRGTWCRVDGKRGAPS